MEQWKRIYRLYGFRPFGFLLIIVLVFIIVIDGQAKRYGKASQQRNMNRAELANKQQMVAARPELEKQLMRAQLDYDLIAPRLPAAETPETVTLVPMLSSWLTGMGMRNVSGWAPDPVLTPEATLVNARMQASILPQHLVKMLQQLSSAPSLVYVPDLEIKVDPNIPNRLQANIRFETVYLPPNSEKVENVSSRQKPVTNNKAPAERRPRSAASNTTR